MRIHVVIFKIRFIMYFNQFETIILYRKYALALKLRILAFLGRSRYTSLYLIFKS